MRRRGVWSGLLVLAALVLLTWLLWRPRVVDEANERPASVEQAGVGPLADPPPTPSLDASTSTRDAPSAGDVFEVQVTVGGVPVPDAQLAASQQRSTSPAWRPTWDPPLTQRTDARGVAVISASTGTWVLAVAKEGFATAVLDVVKPAGERVTVVRVSLERGHDLRGLALDSKDAVIAPATIRATPLGDRLTRRRSSPSGVVEATVDARGRFHFSGLAGGWWRLEGEAEGAGRAEPLVINLPTVELVKLRFRRSGFIEGVVVQPDGGPAAGALVAITSMEGADSLEAGPTGTFSSERMPGAYRVSARLGELVGAADQVALVRAGGTTSTRVTLSGKGGTLSGTVKRDDGVPVGGALVLASPHNDDGLCGQATTAEDGSWAIRGFPRGTFDLEAEAAGLMRSAETGFFVTEGSVVQVDLVLGRLGKVTGAVETSTGAPLSVRVVLHSTRKAFPERQAVSDTAGHFMFDDVPPGPAFIRVRRTPEEISKATDVQVKSGATSEVKVVLLDPVSLEVELDRSRCATPSEVTLVATEANAFQKRIQRGVAASTPRVTLQLSPGAWQLTAWDTNLKGCTLTGGMMKPVTLEAGQRSLPLRLVFGPSEATFEITVLEADGQPSPFASVSARDEKGRNWLTSADAEGVAMVDFPAEAVLTVTASKQGRSAQVKGVRRSLGRATLTLGPAARIHLRLEGASGITRVTALLDGEHFVDEVRATGTEGWIEEIPAGSITLVASNADDTRAGKARVVTVSGQTAEASIRLEALGQVRGKVQLPAGSTTGWISLTSASGPDSVQLGADGAFLFERVVPGDYTAKVECKACGALPPKSVKVAPGASVELQFP